MRQLFDASGQAAANNRYDPYGNLMSHYGDATSVYGFTGEQYDSYIKLLYLRARWYDYGTGRFTQPDPIIPDYADPPSLNHYVYVFNSPANYTDPAGLQRCTAEGICPPPPHPTPPPPPQGTPPPGPFANYVLVMTCGGETNCAQGRVDKLPAYGGMLPLTPLRREFEARGGRAEYVDVDVPALASVQTIQNMADGIQRVIEKNSYALGFFLVGYCSGANGTVVFAAQSPVQPKIKAIALLEPQLADSAHMDRPDSQAAGNVVVGRYPTFIGYATSTEDALPTDCPDVLEKYEFFARLPLLGHTWISVDDQVANDIIGFLLQHK